MARGSVDCKRCTNECQHDERLLGDLDGPLIHSAALWERTVRCWAERISLPTSWLPYLLTGYVSTSVQVAGCLPERCWRVLLQTHLSVKGFVAAAFILSSVVHSEVLTTVGQFALFDSNSRIVSFTKLVFGVVPSYPQILYNRAILPLVVGSQSLKANCSHGHWHYCPYEN